MDRVEAILKKCVRPLDVGAGEGALSDPGAGDVRNLVEEMQAALAQPAHP
jgi:hypothetical protein